MTPREVIIGRERISVTELIGKGGEGEVYTINGNSEQVVKIYKTSLRPLREEKVRAMVGEGLAFKAKLVAYPINVVTDTRGRFLGFSMRFMSGYRPLHELYSPKSRQHCFPNADYRFIVQTGLNVARAVGMVHQTGCLIGDLNHSGVLVAKDATVSLIDADSFQYNLNGRSFPCVVGVPDFTPPELHGKNLGSVVRTVEHDNFALAVALFQLLFMGKHPYAGRHKGPYISMGDAIAQNRFAYSIIRRAKTETSPPPGALSLNMFPDEIAQAFEAAFGVHPRIRPDARAWIQALKILERSLKQCNKTRTHFFTTISKRCVWCELTANSGFEMFPDLLSIQPNIQFNKFGTEQAIREIQSFCFPSVTDLVPPIPVAQKANKILSWIHRLNYKRLLIGILLATIAISALIYSPTIWLLWIVPAISSWIAFSDIYVDSQPIQSAFKDADVRLHRELNAFIKRNGLTEALKLYSALQTIIMDYKTHDYRLGRDLNNMNRNRESRQLHSYLNRFSIRNAAISGIGPTKITTLNSFGIETAADITSSSVLRVPGFGKVMTSKLIKWRQMHESQFKYDNTPNAVDIKYEKDLRGRYSAEKARLESNIQKGINTLRKSKILIETLPTKVNNEKVLQDAILMRIQAAKKLQKMGLSVPTSIVRIPIPQSPKQSAKSASPSINIVPKTQRTSGTPICPLCGSPMRRRSGRYGGFWGCSRFPVCRGKQSI